MRPNITIGDAVKALAEIHRDVEHVYRCQIRDVGNNAQAAGFRRHMDALDLACQSLQAIEKIAGIK